MRKGWTAAGALLATTLGAASGSSWTTRLEALARQPPPVSARPAGTPVTSLEKLGPVTIISGGMRIQTPRAHLGVLTEMKTFRVDETRLAAFVARLEAQVERNGVEARIDPSAHTLEPGLPRVSIDRLTARTALREGLGRGRATIKVPTQRVPVGQVLVPKRLSLSSTLGRFHTEFDRHGSFANRGRNVKLAAQRIDGVVVAPGSVFSFNRSVGPRVPRRGFREASVIVRGELTSGWGGGVCQVASTLHAAAFLAGLEIIQHTPHSRPASYIPMGFDATVVWPHIDLKVRNPYDFPLVFRSWTDDGFHYVEILGSEAPREVTVDREFVSTRPFSTRSVRVPDLAPGIEQVSQGGMLGYTLRRVRLIREGNDETVEETTVVYPPTDRIVHVGG